MESGNMNAKYFSPTIQNELIHDCWQVIVKWIVSEVNNSVGFTVLADETADINEHEQLSIVLRFIGNNEGKVIIREDFLGFSDLYAVLTRAETNIRNVTNEPFSKRTNIWIFVRFDESALTPHLSDWLGKVNICCL